MGIVPILFWYLIACGVIGALFGAACAFVVAKWRLHKLRARADATLSVEDK